jgi:RNA polymerase sigma factor (sigma-70 family)
MASLRGSIEKKTDSQLTKRLRIHGCEESFLELCRRYENVYYKICQKYKYALVKSGVQPEDVYAEKDLILLKCAQSFDPSRNTKFSTWLGNYAKFTCLNLLNSKKYIFNADTEELHDFIEESQFAPDLNDHLLEESKILSATMDGLKDSRIKKIFHMRYFYDKKKDGTWKNISESLGISIQTAINLHKKGLVLLKNRLKGKITIDKFPEQ